CRIASHADNQVRVDRQLEDGKGTRPRCAAWPNRWRRRGDRVSGLMALAVGSGWLEHVRLKPSASLKLSQQSLCFRLLVSPSALSRLVCPITQLTLLRIQPQAWECAPHV